MHKINLLNHALRINGIILDETQLAIIVETVEVLRTEGENFSILDAMQVKENAKTVLNNNESESDY